MQKNRKKYRLFYKLEENLEIPMFLLAIFWLYLFIIELFSEISLTQERLLIIIWILFIVEFLLKLFLAPRKLSYLKNNWITIISLMIPALRVFRIFSAIRILGSARVVNSTRIIRALTSGKRFFSSLKEAQGPQPEPEMNVGILIAQGKSGNKEELREFSRQLIADVKNELEDSTDLSWFFRITDTVELENDEPRRPSYFLDKASQIMVEGPYDLICIITDVSLISRRNSTEAGLLSSVSRIMGISTRSLKTTEKKKPGLSLTAERVRFNAALLFLHLTGHLLGLEHTHPGSSKIMGTENFRNDISGLPSFSSKEKEVLKKKARRSPERELRNGNFLETFIFHVLMTFRNPADFFLPLLKNKAILLPLSLPGLSTAAVGPAIILIFSAEFWDVGLGMTNATAAFFAVASILFGSFYLVRVQSLFLPSKEKSVLTEHLAVTNSVIYFSVFLACIGLFLMLGALIMLIEVYVFPQDLMQTWPTIDRKEITLSDRIRLAVFISTVGVTTGALAGGLESRKLIQHLALFRKNI